MAEVRDLTYYPLMYGSYCAFAVPTKGKPTTYHQCERYWQQEVAGYRFCRKHASVAQEIIKRNGDNNDQA